MRLETPRKDSSRTFLWTTEWQQQANSNFALLTLTERRKCEHMPSAAAAPLQSQLLQSIINSGGFWRHLWLRSDRSQPLCCPCSALEAGLLQFPSCSSPALLQSPRWNRSTQTQWKTSIRQQQRLLRNQLKNSTSESVHGCVVTPALRSEGWKLDTSSSTTSWKKSKEIKIFGIFYFLPISF